MPFDIDHSDSRPIYVQIMDEIRRGIVVGAWRPEEPLPSVRQLAVELRVNPRTVQQAYGELERDGLLYVRRGQGTFVASRANGADRQALLQEVARRLLNEAYRHGFDVDELTGALQREAKQPDNTQEA
ncbi:MAG: GntR family transcriptional regulator [Gemmatimonadota bacterium]